VSQIVVDVCCRGLHEAGSEISVAQKPDSVSTLLAGTSLAAANPVKSLACRAEVLEAELRRISVGVRETEGSPEGTLSSLAS